MSFNNSLFAETLFMDVFSVFRCKITKKIPFLAENEGFGKFFSIKKQNFLIFCCFSELFSLYLRCNSRKT